MHGHKAKLEHERSQDFLKTLMRARDFAIWAHGDQKYGDVPYVTHLDLTHLHAVKFHMSEAVRIAAYLHDVVEDTKILPVVIQQSFGTEVERLVLAVTDVAAPTRRERYQFTLPKIKVAGSEAIGLKLCDLCSNTYASINTSKMDMYGKEQYEFVRSMLYVPGDNEEAWAHLEALVKTFD